MNREILFRAKTVNSGEWVEGITIAKGTIKRKANDLFMEISENKWVGIVPETLSQFTGANDKNDIRIFENHIVKYQIQLESNDPNEIGGEVLECNHKVIFNLHGCGFEISCIDYATMNQGLYCNRHMEIVGNIFDNPEMLGSF